MTSAQRVTVTASVLLAVFLLGTVFTVSRLNHLQTGRTLEEVLYIPSPQTVKRLSLGYDGLMADIYWTRTIQYFGGHHLSGNSQYRLLAPLLQITTYLDPHLLVAYDFGANFLSPAPPNGAGEPQLAIELVENGIRANPDAWRLYYNLGFIYYFEVHDYTHAAEAFKRGSEIPGAHPFVRILAANMAQHAGDLQMARMLWTTTLQMTKEKSIQENATKHLRALQVDEDVTALEKIADLFHQRTGRWPAGFEQLRAAGLLRGVPLDPLGQSYKLMPEGRFEVADPSALPFIEKGYPAATN